MDRRSHLESLLAAHRPADAEEDGYRRRMLALLDAPGDPFSRGRFQPGHFTASAFVLSPEGGELLLIFHGKLRRWLQPGGHVDPADGDVFAAARRELAEETGLGGTADPGTLLDLDIHAIPPNPRRGEPGHAHFDVRILLRARSRDLAAGSDALAARWVPLEAIGERESDRSVTRAALKLLGRR